jgi:uncharacterized protein (TIGR02246 family)
MKRRLIIAAATAVLILVCAGALFSQVSGDIWALNRHVREVRKAEEEGSQKDVFPLNRIAAEYRRSSRDRVAILEVYEQYCEAVCTGNARIWLSLHEPDAYKMPQGQPMFLIADIAPVIQSKWNSGPKMEMEIDCREIEVHGDIAFAMGCYTHRFIPRGGGSEQSYQGKFLTVLRRQKDGSWKIYRDSYSFDAPTSM